MWGTLLADGSFAPATLVPELSSPSNESDPSIRNDGLKIFFHSNRTGSIGTAFDLWVARRASTLECLVNSGECGKRN
jgi:hypothetical protein